MVLHSDDVRSGNSTDTTSVPAQKVNKYRSGRWIALKVFSEVSRGCLTCSSLDSILLSDDVQLSNSTDPTRVHAQKVHKYRSECWIALNFFSGVSGGWFTWTNAESVLHSDDVRSAIPPTLLEYRLKRSINIDPTIGLL